MSAARVQVAYLVSTLRRAGPGSQLLNLLRHLDAGRFEPVVITLSSESADSMLPEFEALGTPVRSLAMSRLHGLVNRGWRRDIERLLGRRLDAASVVHSQGVRGDVIAARFLAGVPRVATARNNPYDDYPLKFGRLPGNWMARNHLRAFRALPNVVACSCALAGLLRAQGIDAAVIPNGVDLEKFQPAAAAERSRLRAKLGLPPGARVGVSVGALSARKDPLTVVNAIRSIDDASLVIAFLGQGPLEADCRRLAGGDSRVRFVGQLADVTPWLRAADFLVSASHAEGLPNAVLEAIACGLPVVLSDIEPHRELLDPVPTAGFAFPVGDEQALARAMARPLPQVARSGVLDPATAGLIGAERMSQQYQALYDRIAGAGARS